MSSQIDGRVARRERNRDAVLTAFVEMVEDGIVDPPIEAVAERAGVSQRSVFRYFSNREELVRAAMLSVVAKAAPDITFDGLGRGTLDERIDALLERRMKLYRAMGPLARAAMRAADTDPLIREMVEIGHAMIRQQFMDHFAPELDRLDDGTRMRIVALATLPLQFSSLDFLDLTFSGSDDLMMQTLRAHLRLALGRPVESPID